MRAYSSRESAKTTPLRSGINTSLFSLSAAAVSKSRHNTIFLVDAFLYFINKTNLLITPISRLVDLIILFWNGVGNIAEMGQKSLDCVRHFRDRAKLSFGRVRHFRDKAKLSFGRIMLLPDKAKLSFGHIMLLPDKAKLSFSRIMLLPDKAKLSFGCIMLLPDKVKLFLGYIYYIQDALK